jgi:hypothetical protein
MDVHEVDAGAPHADQHVVGTWRWNAYVNPLQYFWSAVLLDADGLHGSCPLS